MKKHCFLILFFCVATAFAANHTLAVKVTNEWSRRRVDEPVVLSLRGVAGLSFDVARAKVSLDGREIACQLDDMDGDMVADEIVWLADIDADVTNVYTVTFYDENEALSLSPAVDGTTPRVWAALMMRDRKDTHPQLASVEAPGATNLFNDIHMHGAVMESELVGWRVYFDQRQNLDLYGKRHRRLEIADTEFYTTAEQLRDGYGVDVLWAGGAIGCGTLRGWNDGPTLIDDVQLRGQRIVAAGPLRTVVEVKDMGWKVGPDDSRRVNMRQRYILYAGHRDMEVQVSATGSGATLCTGVQKVGVLAADSVRQGHAPEGFAADGLAASWGCDYPDMGKKQIWPPQAIGLAACVPAERVSAHSESDLNYLLVFHIAKGESVTYHTAFCADMEADGFHDAKSWFSWTAQWQQALSHPLVVAVAENR